MRAMLLPTTVLTNMARQDLIAELADQHPEILASIIESAALRYVGRFATQGRPLIVETAFAAVLEPHIHQLVQINGAACVGTGWFTDDARGGGK